MTPDGTLHFVKQGKPRITRRADDGQNITQKRILIVGATGVFGSRLARHMAADRRFELLLASRSLSRSEAVADRLTQGGAKLTPVELDTSSGVLEVLKELRPWCVADCSGPFQRMGYATARAALSAGSHIVDIADSTGYLAGYRDALSALARRNRRCAIAGASSTPALSGAVVAHLTREMQTILDIDLAILPGGRGEVGSAVIDAILSYAGKPISIWQGGELGSTLGWSDAASISINGLGTRRAAAVSTFDAAFLGHRHKVQGNINFRAGLESRAEQLGVESLALIRRLGLVSELGGLTPLLRKMRHVTRLTTTDRGGMQVGVRGVLKGGKTVTRTWSLIAEDGDGPSVPILPTAAAIKGLEAHQIGPGAKLAPEALCLDEILEQAHPYALRWHETSGSG
ncbi:MAG: saccharopine dehydrogenase NADP-binding domain-containing protein [Pseudomonadota bacterium]